MPKPRRRAPRGDQGTQTSPVEIDNSEMEAALKPDGEDTAHQTQPDSSRPPKCRQASSTSSHQDELIADEEETRAATEALESLQWADDPTGHLLGKMSIFRALGFETTSSRHCLEEGISPVQ